MKFAKECYEVTINLPVYIAVPDLFDDDEDVVELVEECGDANCWDFPETDIVTSVEQEFPCNDGINVDVIRIDGLYDEVPKGAFVYDLKDLVPSDDVDKFFLNMELERAFDDASQAADVRDTDALIALAEKIQALAKKMND